MEIGGTLHETVPVSPGVKRKSAIHWDEAIIASHDLERGTR